MNRINFDNALAILGDHVTETYLNKPSLQRSIALIDAWRVVKRGAMQFSDEQLAMIANAAQTVSEAAANNAVRTNIKGMKRNFETVADKYTVIANRAVDLQSTATNRIAADWTCSYCGRVYDDGDHECYSDDCPGNSIPGCDDDKYIAE